jgi:hypothetical protein
MFPGKLAKEQLLAYTTAAVPHEAGHILIGRMAGLPVRALDHFVIRGSDEEILPGNFATVGVAPMSSAAMVMTPKPVLLAFALFCAGGLAGNLVAHIPAEEYGLQKDRTDLALVTTASLEEVAERAVSRIEEELETFQKLREAIKSSYEALISNPDVKAGRYPILTSYQLDAIVPQNKTSFPEFFQ